MKPTKESRIENRAKKTTHGKRKHRLYNTWSKQKTRCDKKNSQGYESYGGREIKFSLEFRDIKVWIEYVESLEDAYRKGYTIDRIDNNRGYEKGNLRWASKSTQTQNTRKIRKNNTGDIG